MAKFKWVLLALVIGSGYALVDVAVFGSENKPGELTELQQAKGELVKLQIQLAAKDQQIAQCKIQILQGPARQLEQEFLKQVGADPKATWDWQTMTVKKP